MQSAFPRRARVFVLAIALDALLGDPPTAVHPVGWLGRLVRFVEGRAPAQPRARRCYGVIGAMLFPLISMAAWRLLAGCIGRRDAFAAVARDAIALDTSFALRTLIRRAEQVRGALEAGDTEGARLLLRTHLVSRGTRDLTAAEVAGATVESVAENLSDGVIAPWIAYVALGVPGALAYRAINTLDAMWGYRTLRYIDLGWAAARLDDGANWVPARVTALAIVAAAAVTGEDARAACETWRRDGGQTESPNAGRPMAAMAGALGVALAKRGAYTLGGSGREAAAGDIARAVRIARVAAYIVAAALLVPVLRRTANAGERPK